MQEMIKLLIGIIILALAYPLGILLAKYTKEEHKAGRKWFNLIVILSAAGALISLAFWNDVLLFSFLFIIIATLRSLK